MGIQYGRMTMMIRQFAKVDTGIAEQDLDDRMSLRGYYIARTESRGMFSSNANNLLDGTSWEDDNSMLSPYPSDGFCNPETFVPLIIILIASEAIELECMIEIPLQDPANAFVEFSRGKSKCVQ